MNIRETFLKLTEWTYPYGSEYLLKPFLPEGILQDEFGNYFLKIGESDTMFTCHLDTCSSDYKKVKHDIGSQFIGTDGKTILGADDKAGMTILLYMIEKKVPGLYYFFIGEEVGCVGSSSAASLDFSAYNKCVSFDRRGYDSVITEQWFGRCCSDEFASALAGELNRKNLTFNFKPDPTGVFTDSASFMNDIPECTNISVGYFSEHRVNEVQDIKFLSNLCEAVVKVDWNSLPIVRDPNEILPSPVKGYSVDELELSAIINVWLDDEKWSVRLSNSRIVEERGMIYNWVFQQGCYYDLKSIDWDGKMAYINYAGISGEFLGERNDLIHIISDLDPIPFDEIDLIRKLN